MMNKQNIVRHIGHLSSTGSRVFVVFRQLYDDPSYALILYRDTLPNSYRDPVERAVQKGQHVIDLYEVLDKEHLDGNTALTTLHKNGYLCKVKVEDIVLDIGGSATMRLDDFNDSLSEAIVAKKEVDTYNPLYDQYNSAIDDEGTGLADQLLTQAKKHYDVYSDLLYRVTNIDPKLASEYKKSISADNANEDEIIIRLPKGISQTKAIDLVKKALKGE